MILYLLPLAALAMIIIPLVVAIRRGDAAIGMGLKYIAAALPTCFATIGTGIAVANAASAAIGAVSEDEKVFSKALIFVALGEGVAIYGILVSILILNG